MASIDTGQINEPTIPPIGRKEEREERSLLAEMGRQDRMNATIHLCKRALLVVSFAVVISFIFIRVFLLVAPPFWVWLSSEQIIKIDEFFVHGTIGAIVASYLGRYFKEKH